MRYSSLLFDADNTLLDFDMAEHEGLTKAFAELGIPLDEKLRAEYVRLNKSLWKQHEQGLIERKTILYTRFDILFEKIGVNIDGHEAERVYRKYLDEGSYVINGALELLSELSESRDIYIVTNGCLKTQEQRLAASGITPLVKDVFVSEKIGFQKPRREFFDYVKEHIPRFDAKKALIIGDSLTSDIAGGINAGIDTCYYNPSAGGINEDIRPTYIINKLEQIKSII